MYINLHIVSHHCLNLLLEQTKTGLIESWIDSSSSITSPEAQTCCLHRSITHILVIRGLIYKVQHAALPPGQVETFQRARASEFRPERGQLEIRARQPRYNVHHEVCVPNIEESVQVTARLSRCLRSGLHSSGGHVGGAMRATRRAPLFEGGLC